MISLYNQGVDIASLKGYILIERKKYRVFIADDSVYIRERLPEMLIEIPGIEIAGLAERGDTVVETVKLLDPDLVILDIRMPGKNGMEILRELKTEKPGLDIIILTSYPYPQYKKKCLELGASFFFEKSGDFEQLLDTIKELIGKSVQHESAT